MPDIITSSCPQDSPVVMCHVVPLAASLSGQILGSEFAIFVEFLYVPGSACPSSHSTLTTPLQGRHWDPPISG